MKLAQRKNKFHLGNTNGNQKAQNVQLAVYKVYTDLLFKLGQILIPEVWR